MYLNLIVFTVIFRLIGCSLGPRVTSDENVSLFTPLELQTLVLLWVVWVVKNKISRGPWSPWPSTITYMYLKKKVLTKSHSSYLLQITFVTVQTKTLFSEKYFNSVPTYELWQVHPESLRCGSSCSKAGYGYPPGKSLSSG